MVDKQRFNRKDYVEWKGYKIPYFDCGIGMPDVAVIQYMINQISKWAPEKIVTIGGDSIIGNLCSENFPVLCVGLCPSDLSRTMTTYQTLSRELDEEERWILKEMNIPETSVIRSLFTSGLKEQTEFVTRKDVGLPQDKFILMVIGARLDNDVTEDFLKILNDVMTEDFYLVFMGAYDRYDEEIEQYSNLRGRTKNLGMVGDILSRIELCDLYINPTRRGGGTSSVEALYKGKPVVTVDFGDIATNVGKEFLVENYDEMKKMIVKYQQNQEFYNAKSEIATKRAELLTNSEIEFNRIMEKIS